MALENSGSFYDAKSLSRLQRSCAFAWNALEIQNRLRLRNTIIDHARKEDLKKIQLLQENNEEHVNVQDIFELVCEFASPRMCVAFFGAYPEIVKMEKNLIFYFKWAKIKVIAKESLRKK